MKIGIAYSLYSRCKYDFRRKCKKCRWWTDRMLRIVRLHSQLTRQRKSRKTRKSGSVSGRCTSEFKPPNNKRIPALVLLQISEAENLFRLAFDCCSSHVWPQPTSTTSTPLRFPPPKWPILCRVGR